MEERLRHTDEEDPPGSPLPFVTVTLPDSEPQEVRQDGRAADGSNHFGRHGHHTALVSPSLKRTVHRFPVNPRTQAFRRRFFPGAGAEEWNDWRWQLRSRITSLEALARILTLSADEEEAIRRRRGTLPLAITPYYASLLDPGDPQQPLRRCVVPVTDEYLHLPGEAEDPLGEDRDSPVEGLVHRYPDRVLLLATDYCSTNCRYCTRSRMIGSAHNGAGVRQRWERALDYIRLHPEVRDVVVSGGDPLTMAEERLEWLLSRLRAIGHVEVIRIGTKVPAVLPQRVTPALTKMLHRYHPLWMSLHFTHPEELTPETRRACERLADAGIPLGSQTVLLAGINDEVAVMRDLMQGLMRIRVKPYYLFQCDPIVGSAHFRTPVEKGLEILEGLRGHTSGYAVPTYVIDCPGGGGKVSLGPGYVVGREGEDLLLRNYVGGLFRYPDPAGPARTGALASLLRGRRPAGIDPA